MTALLFPHLNVSESNRRVQKVRKNYTVVGHANGRMFESSIVGSNQTGVSDSLSAIKVSTNNGMKVDTPLLILYLSLQHAVKPLTHIRTGTP